MQYLLNGGRNERGVLKYPEALKLYRQLGVKNVLFIVYALVEEDWQRHWQRSGPQMQLPGFELRALTLFDNDKKQIEASLRWADFIYFPGGSQGALLERMKQLGADELLKKVIAEGNLKLLGGGSAGAMVMGEQCIIGHKSVTKVLPGLDYAKGYIVDSHFSERDRLPRLQSVLIEHSGCQGIGIDEDTAALFDENWTLHAVYGTGTVTICTNNKETHIYDQNSSFTN